MTSMASALLSKTDIENLLSQVDLLMAMYPSSDELTIDTATAKSFAALRDWASTSDDTYKAAVSNVPSTLSFELILDIDTDDSNSTVLKKKTQISIDVPTRVLGGLDGDREPQIKARLRQPTWLSKAQTSSINASVPESDDILAKIDLVRELAASQQDINLPTTVTTSITSPQQKIPLVRVWFYFPSLSTRAKRSDLVSFASPHNLTGFVLAGKPGVLCLEGTSNDIDEYMRVIKTESWGDIPSHQKKVSERFREVIDIENGGAGGRRFENMTEITDMEFMGEKRGERGNRNDLKALEKWLCEIGLGEGFGRVFM